MLFQLNLFTASDSTFGTPSTKIFFLFFALINFTLFNLLVDPKIAVNCEMQLRTRKLNGCQSKPIDKAVVKNRVSKTVTITIIHEIVTIIKILDANGHCLDPTMLIQN